MANATPDRVEMALKTVQVVSVVVGVVVSVYNIKEAHQKDAEARKQEAEARIAEANKPLVQLRQKLYLESATTASVLANPEVYSKAELQRARKRFRQLYVVELSMVESQEVASAMVEFANNVDPALVSMTPSQRAAFNLAQNLGKSFTTQR